MEFSAKQIAEYIQGIIVGDENATVHTFAKIEEGVPGAISFLSNPKYTHYIYDTQSTIVLVNKDFVPEQEGNARFCKSQGERNRTRHCRRIWRDSHGGNVRWISSPCERPCDFAAPFGGCSGGARRGKCRFHGRTQPRRGRFCVFHRGCSRHVFQHWNRNSRQSSAADAAQRNLLP